MTTVSKPMILYNYNNNKNNCHNLAQLQEKKKIKRTPLNHSVYTTCQVLTSPPCCGCQKRNLVAFVNAGIGSCTEKNLRQMNILTHQIPKKSKTASWQH